MNEIRAQAKTPDTAKSIVLELAITAVSFAVAGLMVLFFYIILSVSVSVFVSKAQAQDHIPRGLGHPSGGTHWYDAGCCHMQDCEPVEPGAITQTDKGYYVRYLTSRGFIAEGIIPYGSSSIRQSKDGQEHACATSQRVLCIYLPMFM